MSTERESATEAGGGSPGVSKPDLPAPAQEHEKDDFDRLKDDLPDFGGYDEEGLEAYRALSFYFAQRKGGSVCCGAEMRFDQSTTVATAICSACGNPADGRAPLSRAQAARMTCETFGHDAPRGLCRRCGLGVELGKEDERKQKDRISQREAWLASRR